MKIDLCGNWILDSEKYKDIKASVPGSVLGALLRCGSIPDPYYRDNEAKVREYLYDDCVFRRKFTLPRECLSKVNRLMADCIDTAAEIYINGSRVATVCDMHVRHRILLDNSVLREGSNEIEIRITSPYRYINEYDGEGKFITFGETEPKSPCMRKANYMFGWDWGPNLADMGIHGNIYILSSDGGYLKSMRHECEFGTDGSVTVRVQTSCEKDGDAVIAASLSYKGDGTRLESEAALAENNEFAFVLREPKLWYPAGFGEQPLYDLDLCIRSASGDETAYKYRIGVRKIEIDDREDEYGRNFAVYVNGRKIFIKGANYIPQDNILDRVTPERTRRLLGLVKDFNHNTVRVWGGGYYPEDEFYDICDELGLLVSQDLMMACAGYNSQDEKFVSLLSKETAEAVRRFRHHACVYMINGNNECEDQIMSVGEDFMRRYAELSDAIAPVVKRETDIYYLPSSPSSGVLFDCPQDENRLDMHYWEVWHRLKPFEAYKEIRPRMLSEFGCQSMPLYSTVLTYARDDELDLFSPVMAHHQKNHTCNDKILHYAQSLYGKPKNFRDLVYLSMLAQAEGIKTCVEHLRRNKPRCNGALYWQLNDCWPGQSWSSVDYNFGLKALHYYSRKFYAPHLISVDDCGESVKINVSNDTAERAEYSVLYRYMNFAGDVLDEKSVSASVDGASCRDVLEIRNPFVGDCADKLIYVQLCDGEGNFLSENFRQKQKDKDVKYAVPKLTLEKIDACTFSVTADTYAKGVYIEVHDNAAVLSDNFFNLLPGVKKIITATAPINFDRVEITALNRA